ncbi:MAG: ABC transporter substrate-binding protein [Planctomycetes bacterium]|nr:ABC transporter substrate-binding protein [Planctomycetota bacterium]
MVLAPGGSPMRCERLVPRLAGLALCALAVPAQQPEQPIRVAVRARAGSADRLTPLRYLGGFETKTLVYETLVERGPDGRIVPGLASWQIADEGRTFRFTLRQGATWQDGTPVTARAVQTHFRRWVGLPEHDWLPANRHVTGVEVESDDTFVVRLDEPYPLLGDLAAINPCAITAPGSRDWEGEFVRPLGSGPFRFLGTTDDGCWRYQGIAPGAPVVELHGLPRSNMDPTVDVRPLDLLEAGELDAFVFGWDEDLPPARLDRLDADPRFVVDTAPGTSVVYLSFRLLDGPTADVHVRRRIAAAIDRDALVRQLEGGRATPCHAWAAPAIRFWPRRPARGRPPPPPTTPRACRCASPPRASTRAPCASRAPSPRSWHRTASTSRSSSCTRANKPNRRSHSSRRRPT